MAKIVTILLVIIGFMLLATVVSKASTKAKDKDAEALCRNSISFRMMTQINAVGDTKVNLGPLLCKTIDKKIKGNQEQLKANLAYMMSRCWWMFNEAKQDDILDVADVGKILGFGDADDKCFLCYTAAIDQKEMEGGSISKNEMREYLLTEKHPKIKGMTYMDYFQEFGGKGRALVMDDVRPGERYGVLFLSRDSEPKPSIVSAILGTGLITEAYNKIDELTKDDFYDTKFPISTVVLDSLESIQRHSNCKIISDIAEE